MNLQNENTLTLALTLTLTLTITTKDELTKHQFNMRF